MQKIIPCLWYNFNAVEAVDFYMSVFRKNGKILGKSYYTANSPAPEGTVLTVDFEIFGHRYMALNAGPDFPFTNAVSFSINCDTQEEIDYYWESLGRGGKPQQCGWLNDQFGVPWQISPTLMSEVFREKGSERASRVMQAMMKMVKIDMVEIKKAYDGK